MILLVTYDLRKPGRDYRAVADYLRSFSSWAHPLESLWFVETVGTATQVRDRLRSVIDPNDGVLVLNPKTGAWASYGLPDDCASWIRMRL